MDQAITRAVGATPRAVGEFQGYVDGVDGIKPSVRWLDRKNMPQVGDKLYALPRQAAAPRSWAILLTSANHGTVGPVGSTFPHAGEQHERVQVMEIVEAGAPPAPGVDLGGLVRLDASDILPGSVGASTVLTDERIHDIAAASALGVGTGLGDMWNRAEFARAIERETLIGMLLTNDSKIDPVAAQAGQVAVPEGWKLVPIEPTLGMVTEGFDSAPDEFFSPAEEWEAYAELTGCQQAAHRARLCYAAMLAAAPAAPAQAKPLPAPAVPTLVEPIECWSHNEEDFNAQSLGELVDTHELAPGATVWVGEAVHPEPSSLFSTDWLIENMGEAAYDIAGEHAGEDYPNVSDEQVAELEALVVGWIAKCAPPTFWTVKNVRPYVLTAEDCGAQASTAGGHQEGDK